MAKSIIAQRIKQGAVCSVCRSPDYRMSVADYIGGKPNFNCGSCRNYWQYGYNGGVYAKLAIQK